MANNKTLKEFQNAQWELMNVLGMYTPVDDILTSSLFKDILICTAGEVLEVLEHVSNGTKPWKLGQNPDHVREEMKGEMIDILFFLLELFNLADMDDEEIYERYQNKLKKNLTRKASKGSTGDSISPKRSGYRKKWLELRYIVSQLALSAASPGQAKAMSNVLSYMDDDNTVISSTSYQAALNWTKALAHSSSGYDQDLIKQLMENS